jgi:phosphoenolpyruvate carboxylase
MQLIETIRAVLSVTGCDDLSNGFRLLQRSMKVRYPYVDPLNVLQAELMKRIRQDHHNEWHGRGLEDKHILEDALIISINGIAQGMKNSG